MAFREIKGATGCWISQEMHVSSKGLSWEWLYDPAIPHPVKQEKWKYVCTKTCLQVIVTTLFIIAQKWKQRKRSSADTAINTVGRVHAMQCYLAVQRKGVRNTRCNMDELKTTVLSRRQQSQKILYVLNHSTYMKCLEQANPQRQNTD